MLSNTSAFAAGDCADTAQTSFNWNAACATTNDLVATVIKTLAAVVGVAVVTGIVWGGMLYASSNGNQAKAQQGISVIVNAIIGLLLFIFMLALTNFLVPGGIFGRPAASTVSPLGRVEPEDVDNPSGGGGGTRPDDNNRNPDSKEPEKVTTFRASQVLIIGDSITERPANDANHGNKGWWEYLLDGKEGMFKFSAQGGSGYVQKGIVGGVRGAGTSFYDRLDDISRIKPKAIIIAGGLNDRGEPHVAAGIRKYYDKLENVLRANDIPKENVYVIIPRKTGTAEAIVPIVKSNANRIGVRYVEIGSYSSTYDKLHPSSAGARDIESNFVKNSDFEKRLK